MNGKGIIKFKNDGIYKGDFENDEISGNGIYAYQMEVNIQDKFQMDIKKEKVFLLIIMEIKQKEYGNLMN